ncbi:DUF541 domain-containing protein [Nibribacter ruber]|uniref:DUF541 domain-containing protein n=1 Tax=Nibribacter ruber TaxID=2698458 RepID=A0A6P1NYD2_9BACT|nr:SIMPL domain-containing protein [Nibribacter ruber]QHL87394.1 DUF541 domain-containing protein [Nibribacter ruber]
MKLSSLFSPMKASTILPLFVGLLLLSSCGGQTTSPVKQVKVLGYGGVTIYPDVAEISVEASFTKDRMKDAVQEVQAVTNSVLALSKKYTASGEDVRISSISANKDYAYVNGKNQFTGFNSSQSITIKITDLKRLEAFMEELLATKINRIQNISYTHTKADSLRREANALALSDAVKAADNLCSVTKSTRGAVLEMANYRTLDTGNGNYSADQDIDVELYGKGFGGSGFKVTPELLKFKSTCHVAFAIE